MSDAKSQSWWQTVPGMLTGAAAVITAITGLLVVMNQAGWFSGKGADADESAAVADPASSTASNAAKAANGAPRLAPAMQQVRLGTGVFTLLNISAERRTADQIGLRIYVRLQNEGRFPVNFWNDNFRLLVNGVPRAPVGDLNKTLAGNAADEGDVEFIFPADATTLMLQISYYGEETAIPLQRAAQ